MHPLKAIFPLFLFFAGYSLKAQQSLPPIGAWREHLSYQQAIQVLNGDKIYCATKSALFAVSQNSEISRYNKINGLNDIGVSAIGWDAASAQLVIAYQNSNLDILKGSIVKTWGILKDLRSSEIKTSIRLPAMPDWPI